MLTAQNLLIDLNSIACYFGVPTSKGASNEHGQNNFFSSHGILATVRIPQMCCALSRRLQSAKFFMHGSIFMHGLRAIDLSREPARHRVMLAIHATETLSHGHPRSGLTQYIGQRQQPARLANLRRFCPSVDPLGQGTIPERTIWRGTQANGLRAGCNDHRPVPVVIPMGTFSKEQRSHQAAYAFRLALQHSVFYRDHRRKDARNEHSRYAHSRSGLFLYHGSRLPGLQPALCLASSPGVLYRQGQIESHLPPRLFTAGRKINRLALRSNNHIDQLLLGHELSRANSFGQILRFRTRQTFDLPDQSFNARCHQNRSTVQMPLEDRTVLPVDQATLAHQSILRHIRKRRQDTSVDRDIHLRAGGHYQKAIETRAEPLHNFTNFERDHFRQNAYVTSTCGN